MFKIQITCPISTIEFSKINESFFFFPFIYCTPSQVTKFISIKRNLRAHYRQRHIHNAISVRINVWQNFKQTVQESRKKLSARLSCMSYTHIYIYIQIIQSSIYDHGLLILPTIDSNLGINCLFLSSEVEISRLSFIASKVSNRHNISGLSVFMLFYLYHIAS